MGTPTRSSAADRLRPTPWDALVALCVVALAALLTFMLLPRQEGGKLSAAITLDGSTVAVLPLYAPKATEEPAYYTVEGIPYLLKLEYKIGAIRVVEAECPDKDCVRSGWIDTVGEQVICLPNRLVITITGEGSSPVDGVSG